MDQKRRNNEKGKGGEGWRKNDMKQPVNSAVKTREEHAQQAMMRRLLAQHTPHVHWTCPFPTPIIRTRNKAHTKFLIPAICTCSSVQLLCGT